MKHHYTDLATALADPEGVAVLGFFYQVEPLTAVQTTHNCDVTSVFIISALQRQEPEVRAHRHRSEQHQSNQWVSWVWTSSLSGPAHLSRVTLLFSDGNSSLPSISLAQLIPPEKNLTSFYRYKGSLTTPKCTESVVWTLFESPVPLSADQVSMRPRREAAAVAKSFTPAFTFSAGS